MSRSRAGAWTLALCLAVGLASRATPPTPTPPAPPTVHPPIQKEAAMAGLAKGTFEVKMTPQAGDPGADPTPGRMTLDKQFHGDLDATSQGQMLAAMTGVEGSAGYVAMERVTGALQGRQGTFVLQHSGTMTRGTPQLTITVVPDSGTGELAGLAGAMSIEIKDGKHFYELEYSVGGE